MPGECSRWWRAVPVIWTVFFASLLLMCRSRTLAAHDARVRDAGRRQPAGYRWALLFVAVFSFNQFASITSLFVALGVYAASRQWLLGQMMGARAVPPSACSNTCCASHARWKSNRARRRLAAGAVHAVFQPLVARREPGFTQTTRWYARRRGPARAVGSGAVRQAGSLAVRRRREPEPRLSCCASPSAASACSPPRTRLADRIVEQLRRAVAPRPRDRAGPQRARPHRPGLRRHRRACSR